MHNLINIFLKFWCHSSRLQLLFLLCMFYEMSHAQLQSATATFDKDSILIGDHVQLKIKAEYIEGDVQLPNFKNGSIQSFDYIKSEQEKKSNKGNVHYKEITHVLTQFDEGMFQINGLPIVYIQPNKKRDTVYIAVKPIFVKTIEVDTSKEIKPIKSIYNPPLEFKEFIPLLGGSVLIIALLCIAVFLYVKNKKKKEVLRSPEDEFNALLQKIEALKKQQLWTNPNTIKAHHLELSDLIRQHIENRFDVQALEHTTDETLIEFQQKNLLDISMLAELKEILEHCDQVKFAKWSPNTDESERIINACILWIKKTKPQPNIVQGPKK